MLGVVGNFHTNAYDRFFQSATFSERKYAFVRAFVQCYSAYESHLVFLLANDCDAHAPLPQRREI